MIPSLESDRAKMDIIFAYKLLTNKIDCSALLGKFNIFVPSRRLRNNDRYFFINTFKSDYINRSLVEHMSRLLNSYSNWLDMYNSSLFQVKADSCKFIHCYG